MCCENAELPLWIRAVYLTRHHMFQSHFFFIFFHSSNCIYRQFEHGITWIYTSLSTLFSLQLYSLFFFFSSKKNKEEQQLLSCALIHFITVHFTVCIFWNTVGVLIITCTINFWIFISGIMLDVILIYIEN